MDDQEGSTLGDRCDDRGAENEKQESLASSTKKLPPTAADQQNGESSAKAPPEALDERKMKATDTPTTSRQESLQRDVSMRLEESGEGEEADKDHILQLSAGALDEDPALRKILADRAQNSATQTSGGTAASPYQSEQRILEQQQPENSLSNSQACSPTQQQSEPPSNEFASTVQAEEDAVVATKRREQGRVPRSQRPKRKGAYAVAPGGNLARNQTVDYNLIQRSDELGMSSHLDDNNKDSERYHLAEEDRQAVVRVFQKSDNPEPRPSIKLVEAHLVNESSVQLFEPLQPLEEQILEEGLLSRDATSSGAMERSAIVHGQLVVDDSRQEEHEEVKVGGDTSVVSTLSAAGPPEVIVNAQPVPNPWKRHKTLCLGGIVVILLISVGVIVGVVVSSWTTTPLEVVLAQNTTADDTSSSSPPVSNNRVPLPPILETVSERGILRCGVSSNPSLFRRESNGTVVGIDADLCTAIAAAVFGDADDKIEFVEASVTEGFQNLDLGNVDVIAGGTTHTMERQVYNGPTGTSFAFSVPFLYMGLQVAGDPFFVECANNGMKHYDECIDMKICVLEDSSHYAILSNIIPEPQLLPTESHDKLRQQFAEGSCNLIAHESHLLAERNIRDIDFAGEYILGSEMLSKEPLAIVTRDDDPEWTIFVNTVLQALIAAEKYGITQQHSEKLSEVVMFGDNYKDMLRLTVAAVGNYAEVYERDMESFVPRDKLPINSVNDQLTGLQYAQPFGKIHHGRDGSPLGPNFALIEQRGKLRCGVRPQRLGFAEHDTRQVLQGMEIDLCKSLAASLFAGDTSRVEFVEVESQDDGLEKLINQQVDVVAGITWTLSNDHYSGEWISFSQPYFYRPADDGISQEDNLCLSTRADDHQWSSFVYWTLMGMVYADEQGLTKGMSNQMPLVPVFGPSYERMFRDVTLGFGNYGIVYNATLQDIHPRQGRNELNAGENRGGQHYSLPGIVPV